MAGGTVPVGWGEDWLDCSLGHMDKIRVERPIIMSDVSGADAEAEAGVNFKCFRFSPRGVESEDLYFNFFFLPEAKVAKQEVGTKSPLCDGRGSSVAWACRV